MKRFHAGTSTVLAALGLIVLILDSRTAVSGAAAGIGLCFNTVIPSLFPFFVISPILTSGLTGYSFPFFRLLERLLGIPAGGAPLFLIGCLGGYPVGAQTVSQAYENALLDQKDAHRLLGFCNNAGPSFLFGMCGSLFNSAKIPWILWMLQIISPIAVGCILPGRSTDRIVLSRKKITLSQSMSAAVKTMGQVCGWVILFRVILTFLQRWVLFLFPAELQILISGILELSNGCILTSQVPLEGLRFVLCSIFLSLGGICIAMQTASVTQATGLGAYFPGKILQAFICVLGAVLIQPVLFPPEAVVTISPAGILLLVCLIVIFARMLRKQENRSSILQKVHV